MIKKSEKKKNLCDLKFKKIKKLKHHIESVQIKEWKKMKLIQKVYLDIINQIKYLKNK